MRQHRFDLVIDLQSLARSGTFAWLANGQTTIGLDDSREGARGFYDLSVTRPSSETHAVDWYLAVLQRLQVPINQDFIWLPVNEETKKSLRAKWKADDRRWILINPGARWANKRWPVEYFSTLVQMLASDFPQHHFAILGGPDEIALGEKITAMIPERTLDLTGQTSLREMVEWIRLGDFLVTNDTGPMHIGAALGTRVVSLFGPTNPRRTGPDGQLEHALHFSLPCSPCLKNSCANEKPLECLRAISPDQVRNEVLRRMC